MILYACRYWYIKLYSNPLHHIIYPGQETGVLADKHGCLLSASTCRQLRIVKNPPPKLGFPCFCNYCHCKCAMAGVSFSLPSLERFVCQQHCLDKCWKGWAFWDTMAHLWWHTYNCLNIQSHICVILVPAVLAMQWCHVYWNLVCYRPVWQQTMFQIFETRMPVANPSLSRSSEVPTQKAPPP